MAQDVKITNWDGFDYQKLADLMPKGTSAGGTTSSTTATDASKPDDAKSAGSGSSASVSTGGVAPSGGSGGDQPKKKHESKADALAGALKFATLTKDLAKDTFDNTLKFAQEFEKSGIIRSWEIIQNSLGFSRDAYGDINKITNEFARQEMANMDTMRKGYLKGEQNMIHYFKTEKEYLTAANKLRTDMTNLNYRSLESFDVTERNRALLFQKNMNLTSDVTMKLLNRTYAYSGETSDQILSDIAANAKTLGDATGIAFKDLADETAKIMTNTTMFGEKTADQASRIAATYKQLGLDLQTFSGIIGKFRDFDTAATKMGDLSAMFGVQMDAMEMMYLANEDEEEFLHRFRDQLMDQGVDVENMSNTRLRALSDQLGMNQEQLQTFFREGELKKGQAEQEKASADALKMDINSTTKLIEKQRRVVQRTRKDWEAIYKSRQLEKHAGKIHGYMKASDKLQKKLTNYSTKMSTSLGGLSTLYGDIIKKGGEGLKALSEVDNPLKTVMSKKDALGHTAAYVDAESADLEAGLDTMLEKKDATVKEQGTSHSLPFFWHGGTRGGGLQFAMIEYWKTADWQKEAKLASENMMSPLLGGEVSLKQAGENLKNAVGDIGDQTTPGVIDLKATAEFKKSDSTKIEFPKGEVEKTAATAKAVSVMAADVKSSVEVLSSQSSKAEDINNVVTSLNNLDLSQNEEMKATLTLIKEQRSELTTALSKFSTAMTTGPAFEAVLKVEGEELTRLVIDNEDIYGRSVATAEQAS